MPHAHSQLAKFTRPRLHGAVARTRLFSRLDAAREEGKTICIVGPGGAGKTTLAASWLDARRLRGIWYQIDAGDTDLATFFHHLAQSVAPFSKAGDWRLPALTPEYLPDVPAFARRFFRELFARLPNPASVVLDNYQEADGASDFHRTVSDAIAEVPDGVSLIIVSRRDLPASYARHVANGNVAFVHSDELKLNLEEAVAIASPKGHTDRQAVARVHARTDGWAAGLILLLEQGPSAAEASRIASATPQRVFDYFATQILAGERDSVRSFLLATAWLPRVSVGAALALTGNSEAQDILADLFRRRLFVHRREGEEPTYHYHALFRDFLQDQAARLLSPEALRALKGRAAALTEAAGDTEAAIELYCTGADWSGAARLIVESAPQLLAQGRWKTLQQWSGRLPGATVDAAPWLQYWVGRSWLGIDPAALRTQMQQALKAFERAGDMVGQTLAVAGIMESHWVEWRAFAALDPWLDRLAVLLSSCPAFPSAESEMRAYGALLVGISHRQSRNPMLPAALQRAKALLQSAADLDLKLATASMLLAHSGSCLDTQLGAWAVAQVGRLDEDGSTSALARLMWTRRVASHLAHKGDYQGAHRMLERAESLAKSEGLRPGLALHTWIAGFLGVVSGDLGMAERYAGRLASVAAEERPLEMGVVHNVRCMIALARGHVQEALDHGRRAVQVTRTDAPPWCVPVFTIPAIYAMLEAGLREEAAESIESTRSFVSGSALHAYEVEAWLARAYLELRFGATADCHSALTKALQLAAERDYVFLFRTAFAAHRALLSETFRAGLDTAHLRRAVLQYKLEPDQLAGESWPWPVRIYTLGRFSIEVDGQPLVFGRKVPRRLMEFAKALVGLGGSEVPQQKLIELMWPDEEGDAAHHAFTVAVHRLRRLLGDVDAICVADGAVSLARTRVWVDAEQVVHALNAGLEAARTGNAPMLATMAETVGCLYRGPFLPADADAAWSISMRERLRVAFRQFVVANGLRLEAARRWEEAAQWYQRALAADDLAESFYQGLMRCCLQTGAHADGMSAYRRMHQLLSRSLGIQPSPDSESLFRAMQARGSPLASSPNR